MRLIQKLKVKNELGLHIRPATAIVKLLQNTKSSVFFGYNNQMVNARSIMHILMLAAKKNSQIQVVIEGSDAKETMNLLIKAFEKGFGER
ncbi:MAG: HPr family phosphocarrier protein [Chlamydiae bacterium]|nr:HPr family phosphocarrier protein [Chlamydiota bacterium]